MVWSVKYTNNSNHSIEIVDFYKNDYIVGVNDKKIPIPAVVKTNKYFRLKHHPVNFSRKNLFIRDDYSCQYCGLVKEINKLTYDHVIPKSLWRHKHSGSPTSWTNIVTACVDCNRKKGSRTPQQANMPLKNFPVAPKKSAKYLPIGTLLFNIRSEIPEEWAVYLPASYS